MAVSDRHGGGVTLKRVLGADLQRFDALISVGSFGRYGEPTHSIASRAVQVDLPLDRIPERTNVIRRLKPWLRNQEIVKRLETKAAWRRVRRLLEMQNRPRLLVCPQWSLSVELTAKAVEQSGAQYITWVMDDHPLKVSGAAMRYDAKYERMWSQHLRGANRVFVISGAMRDFYRDRFGVDSEVLHGAVPFGESGRNPTAAPPTVGRRLQLGYAGSLSGWQRGGLELVAEALKNVGGELRVAGPGRPEWITRSGATIVGQLDQSSARAMLAECDAAVLPVSFLPEHTAMSRLNIATKLSELCACGRPIVAVGPSDAAMIKELSRRDAAICVLEPSVECAENALRMLADASICQRVVSNARKWFEADLNLEEMQRRWAGASRWLFHDL